MRNQVPISCAVLGIIAVTGLIQAGGPMTIDDRVQAVLERMRGKWRDMNVPEQDGRILHDIIIEKGYKSALEIGTSTGHSTLWIAWALSKTGGKLITLEIDQERRRQAVELLDEAGLSRVVDARLGDAHELVYELSGTFDFVFIDADKGWYTNYAKALIPKLAAGGCITAHNVDESRSGWRRGSRGTGEYLEYLKGLPEFDTFIHKDSLAGVCVSYRKKP